MDFEISTKACVLLWKSLAGKLTLLLIPLCVCRNLSNRTPNLIGFQNLTVRLRVALVLVLDIHKYSVYMEDQLLHCCHRYSKKSAVKKLYETDATVVSMSELIEGLPDAVAIRCIARVPFYLHPKLEVVSRSWQAAVRSTELFKARQEVGSAEDLLCVCAFDPENLWQLYDPLRDLWITLPVLPSKIRHLAHFGVVCSAGKLFVLGGGSDAVDPLTGDQDGSFATNEVWSYDPVLREWAARASMLVPRAMFACCALNGKIVVAGGFTSCQKSISQAEMYDPEKDVWIRIPDLHRTHNSACSGVVIGGKLHVLHRGLSTVQVLDSIGSGWTVEDYGWLQGPIAVVHDALYVMSHGLIVKQEGKTRKVVVSASEFRKRIGFAMTGLGDEMYVIGGVIGPDRWNWDIKPVSDVDILTVGGERPTWRQATPMTQCRGTIRGCAQLRI
ncbi:hypothetical protein NC652_005534 [Populus alba x Populus x berolinensis]|uniref:Uncharacterized protein n=1 Tax=Populus alba x Populus x berolinensis TaxID=444605 RepID=A0AAD6WBH2_9ROSI|nr:hypothetical protein NC652_005534 [Populus alba x Populus x berolinensis]KAJ7006202.1 hypothetical protein NC653_005530 [Populus alba x Populus x berolinensis]